jgi:hypothetical protein
LFQHANKAVSSFHPLRKIALHKTPPENVPWRFKLVLAARTSKDFDIKFAFAALVEAKHLDFMGEWSQDNPPESHDARNIRQHLQWVNQ